MFKSLSKDSRRAVQASFAAVGTVATTTTMILKNIEVAAAQSLKEELNDSDFNDANEYNKFIDEVLGLGVTTSNQSK